MELLALHHNTEYRESCAEVLNEEWPRSKAARLHQLDKSNDDLPYSLVLIGNNESWSVIGHSRLCKVHGVEKACFVESVVIKKSMRGRGFGRVLMDKTETVAKELGYSTCYLTTHDKQDFYGHLGYEFCDPVVSLGGASTLLSNDQLQKLFGSVSDKNRAGTEDAMKMKAQKDARNVLTKTMTNSDSLSNLQELSVDNLVPNQMLDTPDEHEELSNSELSESSVTDEPVVLGEPEKGIPQPSLPPPPLPPPPPPAPPSATSPKTVTRLPQGQIYWMKKSL